MNAIFVERAFIIALVAVAIELLVLGYRFVCFKRDKYPFSFAEYVSVHVSGVDSVLIGVALAMVLAVIVVWVVSPLKA